MTTMELYGSFKNGSGKAGKCFETPKRKQLLKHVFGCADFHGTFNFHATTTGCGLPADELTIMRELTASREASTSPEGLRWWFYVCDLIKGDESVPVVLMIWMRGDRLSGKQFLELLSRERIPDRFKKGELKLAVYGKWPEKDIRPWAYSQPWFQTFPWSPPKADSIYVWDYIKDLVSWHGKRVLDIGGHTGFYSLKAADKGASVTLFEPTRSTLDRARLIGHHIECTDIRYVAKDPGDSYDTILYMSVHHLPDPTYAKLGEKLEELKSRCSDLFLELMAPPLKGDMPAERVDEIVGVLPLTEYKHKVRKLRRIYHVKGRM